MKQVFELFFGLFRFHKLKILTVLGSSVAFFALIFPFSDLTDFVTGKILDATNNQVLFQADKLDVGFFPTVSVDGTNVSVDVGVLPTLEAQTLSLEPSPFSLIGMAFGSSPTSIRASVDATGLLGGRVSISHKPDGSNDEGAKKNHISIQAESVQLGELEKFFDSPVQMRGKANLATEMEFYPAFDGQPEGDVQLTTKELKILPGAIPTQFGPIPMPGFNWSQVLVKLRMGSSTLFLDDVAFGSSRDPMSGRVKGQMNLKIDKNGPIFGAYDVKVELNVTQAAEKDLDTLLVLLRDYRQATASGGGKYVFHVSSNSMSAQPNIGRLNSF